MASHAPTIYLLFFWLSFVGYSTIKNHTNVDELLFNSLSEQVTSSIDFFAEKVLINGFHFDVFTENAITLILERVEAKSIEKDVQDALFRFRLPINAKKAMQIAKHVTKSEHTHTDFVFDVGETGRFFYFRTLTVKRENDNEIDVLLAIYEIAFRLSTIQTVEIKERMPILRFFLGNHEEYRYMEQSLSYEDQELMRTHFRKLAVRGLLRGYYPSTANEGIGAELSQCQTREKSFNIQFKHLYARTSTTNFLHC